MAVKITKARFTLSPFSAEQMLEIGNALAKSIRTRIASGLNANDQPAKALRPGKQKRGKPTIFDNYPDYKSQHGIAPIRNWTLSGRTLRALQVLSVNQNKGTIGFTDAKAARNAYYNNKIEKTFAISDRDRLALSQAVRDVFTKHKIVDFRKVS